MKVDKTPTGKAFRGNIGYTANKSGMVIINLPRQWFPLVKSQIKVPLGIRNHKDNHSQIEKAINRLQIALEDGRLHSHDGTLDKVAYQEVLKPLGIFPNLRGVLRVVEGGKVNEVKKDELSLLEIWDRYCEYRKPSLAITTYKLLYQGQYLDYLKKALIETDEKPLSVRAWLIENRSKDAVIRIFSIIEKAYNFAIHNNLYHSKNPYLGFSNDIDIENNSKEIKPDDYTSSNADYSDKIKAYTWDEVQTILHHLKHHEGKFRFWYHFTAFRFLTGCRPGEAQALWWCDVKWEKEVIVFRRTYSSKIRKFKSTKNNTERLFPMPMNGELWNILKDLKQGNDNECVFLTKTGKRITTNQINNAWKLNQGMSKGKLYEYPGFITELVEQGKISSYLPPYNTRHTFITHAIYDLGIPSDVINSWCEHSEEVSKKHYRDVTEYAKKFNPDRQAKNSEPQSELELLREMVAKQQAQIEELGRMVSRDSCITR